MYKIFQVLFFVLFISHTALIAQEKPREYSPYSRFGLGDLTDPHFNIINQFGGAAAGYADRNILNLANPASLGTLRNTAFEVGVSSKFNTLKEGNNKQSLFGGGLDYLALGFSFINPINEALDRKVRKVHAGSMISLKPYSQVGYDISQLDSIEGTGAYRRNYKGNGGTYEFKWNTGMQIKNLSVGIGLGYLFGKSTYTSEIRLLSVPIPYNTIFQNHQSVKGFRWNYGVQYKINLKKPENEETESTRYLSVGLYGNSINSFKTINDELYRRQLVVGTAGVTDTVRLATGVEGTGKLPSEFSAGIYYFQDYKLQLGAQFSLLRWSQYENSMRPDILKDASNFSFGIGYTPDIESFNSLLKRITYRIGFRSGSDPRFLDNKQLKNLTVTFGGSVPFVFQRKVSFVNFGVEMGSVGIKDQLRSKFVQLKLGFTLNDDDWFLKRKYN